jgi:hypothetical protein
MINQKPEVQKKTSLEEYLHFLHQKCEKRMPFSTKNKEKIMEDSPHIPTPNQPFSLFENNYNLNQVRYFAKSYRLKISGNKKELLSRVFSFLFLSNHAICIQKHIRGYFVRTYIKKKGKSVYPSFRVCCNNPWDFLTLDKMQDISFDQFFSFKDKDGFVYGFDILSLQNLILKTPPNSVGPLNPYNRIPFSVDVLTTLEQVLKRAKMLKRPIQVDIENVLTLVSKKKSLQLQILNLCQTMDSLGNYSNPEWFFSLGRNQWIRFLAELRDIWEYRAQLSDENKRLICPPLGDPFVSLHSQFTNETTTHIENLQQCILPILEKIIGTGVTQENQVLGCFYVLGALTMVSGEVANALPWLFENFSTM